jgi:hypothetical protein
VGGSDSDVSIVARGPSYTTAFFVGKSLINAYGAGVRITSGVDLTSAAAGTLYVSGSTSLASGLNVGSATGAATGEIKASASISGTTGTFTGGLNVGSATGAGTGEIATSGNVTITKAANPTLKLSSTNSGGGSRPIMEWNAQNNPDSFYAVYMADGSPRRLSFIYNQSTEGNGVAISITSTNRLGVNTASPGYTLDAAGDVNSTGVYRVSGTQVVRARVTGWAAATGTATRTTFATGTVTTAQLAERVKALIDDLTTHGLIGA